MLIRSMVASPLNDSDRKVGAARALALRHGWNATAFQIVNPGFDLWFDAEGEAVVGSMVGRRTRVVAGAPICALERLEQTVDDFEKEAESRRESVCYFGAAGRMFHFMRGRQEYSIVNLGSQPVWRPAAWVKRTHSDAALRAQFNRARNKGVAVREWTSDRARANPSLERILHEWLETRGLPPLHFLVEPETLQRLEGRRIFVAERNGVPVAFTVLSPVPKRSGWLTEQFPRGHSAPNGTVELMMDVATQTVAAEGAEYLTMGLVPLTQSVRFDPENPLWLRVFLAWVRVHGRRFYNFEGLESFKRKFHPEGWEEIYVVSKEPRFSLKTLYSIATVFAGGSPLGAVSRGARFAIGTDLRRAVRAVSRTFRT